MSDACYYPVAGARSGVPSAKVTHIRQLSGFDGAAKTMEATIGFRHSTVALLGRTARQIRSFAASAHAGQVLVGRKRDSQSSRACSAEPPSKIWRLGVYVMSNGHLRGHWQLNSEVAVTPFHDNDT
jgi:hypothetical protein